MVDNISVTAGSGTTVAADDVGGVLYQRVKLSLGADGSASDAPIGGGVESGSLRVTIASDSTGVLSIDDNGGSLTVDGTVSAAQSGTWNVGTVSTVTNVVHVDDNAGSLTVDGTVAATQSGTWNVGTVGTVTNVVHVDDNAGSLTVDGTVAATQSGTWNVGTVSTVTNVVHVDDNSGSLTVDNPGLTTLTTGSYETVAASQTDQAMGATGATGDYLAGVLIIPATTSPGAVSIKDGSGSSITVFTGGATSVSNLVPFFVPLGIVSGSGAWKVTTGANVSAIGVGKFT